jgi:hypothetical protein
MRRGIEIAIFVTFISCAICATIYGIHKERTTCDTRVTLTDGTTIEATRINSYSSGMSDIRCCDGSYVDVPTIRIKMVERLDSVE